MQTDCTPVQLEFQALGRRSVEAAFDAGLVTSDGGGLLLREAAVATRDDGAGGRLLSGCA